MPAVSGKRFGILVHALLAAVSLDAAPQDIAALALIHARLLGATDEERAAAANAADRVLRHPVLNRARLAIEEGRACRREVALSLALDAAIVDGQADLVWDDGERWVVVDFKTDVEMAGAEDSYRRQVAIYVEAVTRATGKAARGILLRV